MRPRKQLMEKFSSFLLIDSVSQQRWTTSAPLLRSLKQAGLTFETLPEEEQFWTCYWYGCWEKAPRSVAIEHLCAFLQEACYWSVRSLYDTFKAGQFQLADLFQIAISHFEYVLRKFNQQNSFDLSTYARYKFKHIAIDKLRQQKEIDVCSPWSLLQKLSAKQVRETLNSLGINAVEASQRLQMWHLYKAFWATVKADKSQHLSRPTPDILQNIAKTYSDLQSQQAGISALTLDSQKVERDLLEIAQAARDYLYPKAMSLNVKLGDEEFAEHQDLIADTTHDLSWTAIVQQETLVQQTEQQQQVKAILVQGLAQLSDSDQLLLERYYSQDATQQAIAQELGLKQYQIARHLSRIRRCLLKKLVAWATESMHISPDSIVVNNMDDVLKVWLQTHFQF